ncbi:MAG TPA: hypothetical protein VH369_15575 [Bryobacteraceae bacterium]
MLTACTGKERTEQQQYRELFAGAGLRVTRFVPTRQLSDVLEAVPA